MNKHNTKKRKTVYFDVENTLEVPFITGIQRVTKEFSRVALSANADLALQYEPVIYDHKKQKWRHLSKNELRRLKAYKPRSTALIVRVIRRLFSYIPKPRSLYIDAFEANSIFLDIDSSWHSKLGRTQLLPMLKELRVKVVKLHYDIIPILFPTIAHPRTIDVFNDHFHAHLKYADLFLCISNRTLQDVAKYCEEKGIQHPPLEQVTLGTDLSSNEEQPRFISPTLPCLGDIDPTCFGQYIICVGTIEPRKNHTLLIDAFDQVSQQSNLNLVIVGKPGWLADNLLSKITSHQYFGKRLFHLENVSDKYLGQLYKHAWINVVPSHYEGFGLPVSEALIRGCPTISSSAGSLPEVGGKFVRLFSPNSEQQLANIILELAQNQDSYSKMKLLARGFIPTSWTETTKQIDSLVSSQLMPV